jgi:glutamine synthetase
MVYIIRVDYVWTDSDGEVRDKTRILYLNTAPETLDIFPIWTFDGSSTGQANTKNSDLLLKPVKSYKYKTHSKTFDKHYIVLCEVLNPDYTIHETNKRQYCLDIMHKTKSQDLLFGIEQEYLLIGLNNGQMGPYQWTNNDTPYTDFNNLPVHQGKFYCSVGGLCVFGRPIIEEHIEKCIEFGIKICGTNSEVLASQWEYQIGPISGFEIGDQLIISRYLLKKIAEKYNADISFHPKPIKGWNGSGGHTNFSTKLMREGDDNKTGLKYIIEGCEKLAPKHNEHMEIYGKDNDKRLCGNFETSDMDNFSYGVADRSCSIRIPQHVNLEKKGYLEDRRPASNLNPYLVCGKIAETICL